jgi:hypothetical protein
VNRSATRATRNARSARRRTALAGVAAAAVLGLACGPASAETIETTDGRRITGKVLRLDARQAVVRGEREEIVVPLARIATVSFQTERVVPAMDRKGQHVVVAGDGSLLAASGIRIGDGRLEAAAAAAGRLSVPLKHVARLWRPLPAETPHELLQRCGRLRLDAADTDLLVVRRADGPWVPVPGLVDTLADGRVTFTYAKAETSMPDDPVAAIVFAGGGGAPRPAEAAGQVIGTDGSRVAVNAVALDAERVKAESAAFGNMSFARESVAEIRFRNAQGSCLSDLDPAEVDETPFFDDGFAWRKDRSASGRLLAVGGVTYEKGIGLHARCRLSFDLKNRFARFRAVAGIDDDAQAGKASLSILADGKPLVDRLVLDRARAPEPIDVDVRGAATLAVLVDFEGGTFGSGARVNLCDAQLRAAGE